MPRTMRKAAWSAVFIGSIALAWRLAPVASGQPPVRSPQVDPRIMAFLKPTDFAQGDSELQKKLKERHNVAVKLLEARINEYKKGARDASSVFEAARLTADAKLDLADTPEARTTVLEQTLGVAKLVETHLEEQLKKGFGSQSDLERARLARLTVEVELLKAKDKRP